MKLTTQLVLLGAFVVSVIAFVDLRTPDGSSGEFGENSVRCRKLEGHWHEPHGISPGYCGPALPGDKK